MTDIATTTAPEINDVYVKTAEGKTYGPFPVPDGSHLSSIAVYAMHDLEYGIETPDGEYQLFVADRETPIPKRFIQVTFDARAYAIETLPPILYHGRMLTDALDRVKSLETALKNMCAEFRAADLPYGSKAYVEANALLTNVGGDA